MRFRRWRLATLMGLVVLAALGIKGALYFLPKHDIVRDRLAAGGLWGSLPRSPQIEAQLVALLNDPEVQVRWGALLWLDRIDSVEPAMIPKLVELLLTETREIRLRNRWSPDKIDPARSLIRFQLPASVIAPLLRPALTGSVDGLARSRAVEVLSNAAARAGEPSDPTLVALLLGALDDAEPQNRLRAGEGLARLDGAARRRAVGVLTQHLGGPDRPMALVAAASLARFDPERAAGAKALADRLDANTDDPTTRVEDLYLLGRIGPPSRVAVPAIVRAMTANDTRQSTGFPLQRFHPRSEPWGTFDNRDVFLPGDTSSTVSGRAGPMGVLVLGRIGPEAGREAVAILTGMLRDGQEARRLAAAEALADMGLRASSAFGELLALVDRTTTGTGGWKAASTLVGALGKIVPKEDPILVAALIRLLGSDDEPKRHGAARALAAMDPAPTGAIPALVAAASDPIQGVRWSVAERLGRCAARDRDAVEPALRQLLRDPDGFIRLLAAESLGRLRAETAEAVAVAIGVLRSQNDAQRDQAVQVLGGFGPAARSAIPALRALRSDPSWAVREHVVKALGSIDPTAVE